MKNKTKALFLGAAALFMSHMALAQNYYVDNINGDDSNDGMSWATAFKTLRYLAPNQDFNKWSSMQHPDNNFYIRATAIPYRVVDNTVLIGGIGHYYFDATGNGTDRGSDRAKLYGSQAIAYADWNLLSQPSSPVKIYYSQSPYSTHAITRAYIDTTQPQRLIEATDLLNIQDQQYYLDDQNGIYLRSDAEHPGNMNIEWIADHDNLQAIEGFYNMSVHGPNLKYFTKGYSQGGCHTIELENVEASYNARSGIIFNSGLPEGAVLHDVVAHHNGEHGIVFTGYANTRLYNCVSHHNGGDGIQLLSGGAENSDAVMSHCSSFNNGGRGVYIETAHQATGNATSWTLMNNIASGNAAEEFYLADAQVVPFALFNGWFGSNNALFEAYPGFSNLVNVDPQFVDAANGDYHLSSSSAYISQGVHTVFTADIDGDTRDVNSPDIGADEF